MPVSFTAYADEGTDIRAKLFPALSAANAFILTMKEEEMTLEDIFLQLTKTSNEEVKTERETEATEIEAAETEGGNEE